MSQAPPTPPDPSAPGAWRWDGRTWVPRAEAASAPTPEAPEGDSEAEPGEEAGGGESSAQEAETEEENRIGWLMIGGLIAISLLVIAAIIGGSLLLYRAAGSPPPNAEVTSTPSAAPVDPSRLDYRYLPGVTVGSLTSALTSQGFACQPPTPPEANLRTWRCDQTRGSQQEIVQIWAVDPAHVHVVDLTTVAQTGDVDQAAEVKFQSSLLPLLLPSSADAAAATSWAAANASHDGSTEVAGITLRRVRTEVAGLLEVDAGTRH